jgi:flagellar motility protein MotE (MotC chaperone)
MKRKKFPQTTASIGAFLKTVSLVIALLSILTTFWAGSGIAYAIEDDRQKESEDVATAREGSTEPSQKAMEAFADLVDGQPVYDQEFVERLEKREKEVVRREQELARREEELRRLESDILQKLKRLETARVEVEAMTTEIDRRLKRAEEDRLSEIADAVKRFKSMGPEAAARILLQMDLESGATIVRQLSTSSVGGIFDAMVEEVAATGTDSEKQAKQEKMAQLWERLVNPERKTGIPQIDKQQNGT